MMMIAFPERWLVAQNGPNESAVRQPSWMRSTSDWRLKIARASKQPAQGWQPRVLASWCEGGSRMGLCGLLKRGRIWSAN